MNRFHRNERGRGRTEGGYIALVSAVILSFVLTGLAFSTSQNGYFARSQVSNSEYKRVSLGLAESCVSAALLKIAQNYGYAPAPSGDIVPVGSDECTIVSVTYGAEVSGRKTANIATRASYQGAWSDVKVSASVASPSYSAITRATLTVYVHVVNNSGGSATAGQFSAHFNGSANPSVNDFPGSESGTAVVLDPSTPSIVVTNGSGGSYIESFSSGCSAALVGGASATCVITEDDVPTTAQLTVTAKVKNDNGGTRTASDFPLTLDGSPVPAGIPQTVSPGTHHVAGAGLSGYTSSNWGYDCDAAGDITLTPGQSKTCIINYDDIPPPAPACADTVMMFDRTGSISASDLANERAAGKALIDLYANITPTPPQIGIGRFGGATNDIADIFAQLTNVYGSTGSGGGSVGPLPPTGLAAPNQWTSPVSGLLNDAAYTTSAIQGREQGYSGFGVALPPGASVSGITVGVNGKSTSAGGSPTDSANLNPIGVGNYNSWAGFPTNTSAGKTSALLTNDGNSSYVGTTTYSTKPGMNAQTFVMANANVPAGATINSVTLYVVASGTPTNTSKIRLRLENGTGVGQQSDEATDRTLTSSYSLLWRSYATNPFTGAAWTLAEVNAWTTRFGFIRTNSTNSVARVSQLYVVVNYTPSATLGDVGVELSWDNGTTWTSSGKHVTLGTLESGQTIGGSADTWGRAWTGTEMADGNFLLRLHNNTPAGGTAYVNYLTVSANYTIPASGLYAALDANLDSTSAGGTNLISGTSVGNGELNSVRHDPTKAKVLIILSDGKPTRPDTSQGPVLDASDAAKLSGTKIYTIHFGDVTGRPLLASIANGTAPVSGHQPGSANDQASITAENNDGDNFFITPDFPSLQAIFEQVGTAVCPAAGAASTPPPTKGTLSVVTQVVNDNGGTKVPADFTLSLASGLNPTPSATTFAGVGGVGYPITLDAGGYGIAVSNAAGYSANVGALCAGTIAGGDSIMCTVTFDDPAPTPPPPPPPPPGIDIGQWEEGTGP